MVSNERLYDIAKELGIDLSDKMCDDFEIYKELLKEWNEKINITSITDNYEIDLKHFADSLTPILTDLIKDDSRIIDIGTGGGFPGIPLKIYNQTLKLTLLDSLNKRIVFLNEVITKLDLNIVETLHARAEEYSRKDNYREKYDICLSRAVASLETLCEYCIPYVKENGYFISMKGPTPEKEIEASINAIKELGGVLERTIRLTLPNTDMERTLIIIKKVKKTPDKYPRGGGKPKKMPIK
ncbi:MAG: 16S rRNA (guanine(527)-N(7))-methyltransferase RsmG [Gudongella sp.]|nr:16S rRNA (guanine(527)-N(7))-methyltransferase RsmG [Gudongella sp.]